MERRYVLVVDDDEDARMLMGAIVKSMDIPVETAKDGIEALERIRDEMPAFVILDLMMPRMDGFGVLSHLQLNPKTRAIPILILTAYKMEEKDILDLRGTVLGVIQKGDLDLDEIGKVIKGALGGEEKPDKKGAGDNDDKTAGGKGKVEQPANG